MRKGRALERHANCLLTQNKERNILGCKHYQRNAKLQADCCGRWFTCRLCHDEACDHTISRHATKMMMCMACALVQPVARLCARKGCNTTMGKYYCDVCKFWDNSPMRSLYHCAKCGICRVGKGIGYDYFHCDTCNTCISSSLQQRHQCTVNVLDKDCPVCDEYLFTSIHDTQIAACGHAYHSKCYKGHLVVVDHCPECSVLLLEDE
ncbi:hypothetical protein THASP1DRAFT_16466 [Thamnocephalis sphaerospora]|uniref:Zinc-ribbon-domain-containing protein n=1 Tax=Thamnocephalis sphaerospora TaxID=78915 RepID=A0A4P9XPE7_9FUNG|nr:hypothetical protein THASP1DRAFT_16466 [Thamnocephalis sphaerospora]|eukprot:RKP07858.1 hypothetical protein THASP1DRAFT_16466 [Thamnocephalis sphaerospora]